MNPLAVLFLNETFWRLASLFNYQNFLFVVVAQQTTELDETLTYSLSLGKKTLPYQGQICGSWFLMRSELHRLFDANLQILTLWWWLCSYRLFVLQGNSNSGLWREYTSTHKAYLFVLVSVIIMGLVHVLYLYPTKSCTLSSKVAARLKLNALLLVIISTLPYGDPHSIPAWRGKDIRRTRFFSSGVLSSPGVIPNPSNPYFWCPRV